MDLSAARETMSRRPNICSARRKMVESVSGKSIIRPCIGSSKGSRFADCSSERAERAEGLGTNYPLGIVFPFRGRRIGQKGARNREKHADRARHCFCVVVRRMPRTILVEQAAALLGVSRRTVYYRIRDGKLRTVRTRGGSQRVLVESIEELQAQQVRDPAAAALSTDPCGKSQAP